MPSPNKFRKKPLGIQGDSDSYEETKTSRDVKFPSAWLWLVDEAIPAYVKREYSPRDAWKDKLFGKEDSKFFVKSISELSTMFTDERPRKLPAYFNQPKFRSAYLLYFLPLQLSKFVTLFQLHPKALEAIVAHGREKGVIRIADLGAGPGTASIALLLTLLDTKLAPGQQLPPVELDWLDTNRSTMEDGKALVEQLAQGFPKLRGKVTIRLHVEPWWNASRVLKAPTSLVVLGHVLNEAAAPKLRGRAQDRLAPEHGAARELGVVGAGDDGDEAIGDGDGDEALPSLSVQHLNVWQDILARAEGGGVMIAEPAMRSSSQNLSQLRDELIAADVIEPEATSIWGPCLHAGNCPLARGRDWCHFSVPVMVPGIWYKEFSKQLSSERQWVKFSYLWLASRTHPAPEPDARLRRVASDPLRGADGGTQVLLCEPDRVGRMPVEKDSVLRRGALVDPAAPEPRAPVRLPTPMSPKFGKPGKPAPRGNPTPKPRGGGKR